MNSDNFYEGPWGPGSGGPWDRMQMFQARRGDIKMHILKALTHRPMHGYEIMGWLEEKSHGMWRPSPGSVYPTLQLLEDEDLVRVDQEEGKKVYQLTQAGEEAAKKAPKDSPWKDHKNFKHHKQFRELAHGGMRYAKAIIKSGDEPKIARLVAALEDLNQKLKSIAEEK